MFQHKDKHMEAMSEKNDLFRIYNAFQHNRSIERSDIQNQSFVNNLSTEDTIQKKTISQSQGFLDEFKNKFGKKENTVSKYNQSESSTSLPSHMRMRIEQRYGLPMDDVRIHYNSDKPEMLGALAYTQGTEVFIGRGQEEHLEHELGHIIQQKKGMVQPTRKENGIPVNDSPTLEKEAESIATANANFCMPEKKTSMDVVQMFRLVKPADERNPEDGIQFETNDDAEGALFSTHKIEHINSSPANRMNQAFHPETNIDAEMLFQLSKSIDTIIDSAENKKENYDKYFRLLGRISQPQPPNMALGATEYITRNGTDTEGAEGANTLQTKKSKLSFLSSLFPSFNKSVLDSRFEVKDVSMNIPAPMLVSENSKFALNALYAEPKEVFIEDSVMPIQPTGNLELKSQENTKIKIKDKVLKKYIPVFTGSSGLETHACDVFKRKYFGKGKTEPLYANIDRSQELDAPWDFHTAGILCEDGSDQLSLENSARFSWLFRSQNDTIMDNEGPESERLKKIDDEMKKTWYFRMYGPEEYGQDIKNQTESRLKKPE